MERPEESVAIPLRRSRAWAIAGFLLLLTALWLPWWHAAYDESTGFDYDFYARPFGLGNADDGVRTTAVWTSSLLASGAAGWLFVRIAGRSHAYEPATWRRDLGGTAILAASALAGAMWWPTDLPFWGGRMYGNLTGGATASASFQPAGGWWLGVAAVVCLGVAWWLARPRTPSSADRDADQTATNAPRAK